MIFEDIVNYERCLNSSLLTDKLFDYWFWEKQRLSCKNVDVADMENMIRRRCASRFWISSDRYVIEASGEHSDPILSAQQNISSTIAFILELILYSCEAFVSDEISMRANEFMADIDTMIYILLQFSRRSDSIRVTQSVHIPSTLRATGKRIIRGMLSLDWTALLRLLPLKFFLLYACEHWEMFLSRYGKIQSRIRAMSIHEQIQLVLRCRQQMRFSNYRCANK